ncbi:unnamed protein product [Arctogadus glacialis]
MKMYSSIIDRISVFVVRAQARGLAAGGSVLVKRPGNQSHPVWLLVGLYTGGSVLVTRPGNQSHAVWLLRRAKPKTDQRHGAAAGKRPRQRSRPQGRHKTKLDEKTLHTDQERRRGGRGDVAREMRRRR